MARTSFTGTCPHCGKTFTQSSIAKLNRLIGAHAASKHPEIHRQYTCVYCQAVFSFFKEKQEHEKSHLKARYHPRMTSTHEKSSISPVIAGKPLEKLREIHDHLGNAQMLDTIKDVVDFYYKNNMEQIIMDMKTAESEKFAELQNEAEKRGYDLSADAEKMVKAMIKREKKLGGIYCPCRNIVLMEDEEKKKYTCPCVDLDNDIKETGACHCGVFVKKKIDEKP